MSKVYIVDKDLLLVNPVDESDQQEYGVTVTPAEPAESSDYSDEEQVDVSPLPTHGKYHLLKEKIGIVFVLAFFLLYTLMGTIFIPDYLNLYVSHKHPEFTPDEIASESSRLKSISDGTPYAMYFLFGPLLGLFSDRFGRKIAMFLVMSICAIDIGSSLICYNKLILVPFYITHTLAGLSNGGLPICFSYLADITTREQRPIWFAAVGAGLGFSVAIGPIVGSTLSRHNPTWPLYASFATLGIAALALLFIKESTNYNAGNPITVKTVSKRATVNPFKAIFRVFTANKYVGYYAILNFSFSFTSQDAIVTGFNYAYIRYDWGVTSYGYCMGIVGIFLIIWSAVALPVSLRFTTFFVSGVFHILYAFCSNQYLWVVLNCFGSFPLVLINLIQSIISNATPAAIQGSVLSGVAALGSLSSFLGALFTQNVFAYFISPKSPIYMPGMHFLIDGGLIFLTFIYSVYLVRKVPTPPNPDLPKTIEHTPILSINDQ
eukprot:gene9820-11470_t